jgi:predicted cupin superfamily sugar epimerase
MSTAREWIERLELKKHPEGGYYRETFRANGGIALPDRFGGPRPYSTAIYFLITPAEFSCLHRLASDETWHFYTGSPLVIRAITPQGERKDIRLGPDFEQGQRFQATVGAGNWFGAKLIEDRPGAFALVGCTLSPGFEFSDFELATRAKLLREFPRHADFIREMTRS